MVLTTQWSQIERLQGEGAAAAWRGFVDRYRAFVEAALRRLLGSAEQAATATEEFRSHLLPCRTDERAPRPPRFRGFLVGALRSYAHAWRRRHAPAPPAGADPRPVPGPELAEDEEVALWAQQVLHLAVQRLARESPRQAAALAAFYGLPDAPFAAAPRPRRATGLALELGLTARALHELLCRGRAGLRECLLAEVRDTVGTAGDLAAELEVMVAAVGRATPGIVGPCRPTEEP